MPTIQTLKHSKQNRRQVVPPTPSKPKTVLSHRIVGVQRPKDNH